VGDAFARYYRDCAWDGVVVPVARGGGWGSGGGAMWVLGCVAWVVAGCCCTGALPVQHRVQGG